MKKITFIFLSIIFLIACSGNKKGITKEEITGNWEIISVDVQLKDMPPNVLETYKSEGLDKKYELLANGNYNAIYKSGKWATVTGKWTLNGNKNTLTLKDPFLSITYTIKECTNGKMIWVENMKSQGQIIYELKKN